MSTLYAEYLRQSRLRSAQERRRHLVKQHRGPAPAPGEPHPGEAVRGICVAFGIGLLLFCLLIWAAR